MRLTEVSASTDVCGHCGWPEADPYEVASRHATSEGVIVYTRCVCGALQVRRYAPGDAHPPVIARSRNAAAPPASGRQQ